MKFLFLDPFLTATLLLHLSSHNQFGHAELVKGVFAIPNCLASVS